MRKTDLKTQKNEWEKVRCTSFSRWLFSYVGKNPQVHDLASDAKRDSAWPRRARNFWEFHQHHHAEKAAIYWIGRATSRYDMEHGFQRWQDALLNTQNA